MKNNKAHGFTLIELLVVITIIGILAVGGVSVYTKQMAKARDTTRIKDIKAIEGSMQSFYSDGQVYPTFLDMCKGSTCDNTKLKKYISSFPTDPKTGDDCNSSTDVANTETITPCDYLYKPGTYKGLDYASFEISAGFENSSNSILADASGNDTFRYEVGVDTPNINTRVIKRTSAAGGSWDGTTAVNTICDSNAKGFNYLLAAGVTSIATNATVDSTNASGSPNKVFVITSNCN